MRRLEGVTRATKQELSEESGSSASGLFIFTFLFLGSSVVSDHILVGLESNNNKYNKRI